jgi:hypothetical protein
MAVEVGVAEEMEAEEVVEVVVVVVVVVAGETEAEGVEVDALLHLPPIPDLVETQAEEEMFQVRFMFSLYHCPIGKRERVFLTYCCSFDSQTGSHRVSSTGFGFSRIQF